MSHDTYSQSQLLASSGKSWFHTSMYLYSSTVLVIPKTWVQSRWYSSLSLQATSGETGLTSLVMRGRLYSKSTLNGEPQENWGLVSS